MGTADPDTGFALQPGDFVLHSGRRYAAVLIAGVFRPYFVHHDEDDHLDHYYLRELDHGEVFRPLAPGTAYEDIDGATHARDTGTHWVFSKASPDEMHDREAACRSFVHAIFQPEYDTLLTQVLSARTPERALSYRVQWDRFVKFRAVVEKCAVDELRKQFLGQEFSVHGHVSSCLASAITLQKLDSKADYHHVRAEVSRIVSSLSRHAYEFRVQQLARLKAEAEAEAKARSGEAEAQ